VSIPATITTSEAANAVWGAAVIGAGPAGSVTAGLLAGRGLKTLLIDRAHFPRSKVCGSCLNRTALAALTAAGVGEVPSRLGALPLDGVKLASGGRTARLAWPGGVSLSREALDAELIREAVAAGAEFLPGTRAAMGEVVDGYRRVRLEQVFTSARVVIVADGLNGQLAADAAPGSRIGAGAMVADPPAWCAPGTVYMASAAGGYVGLVLVEGGRLDVAAAFDAAFVKVSGGLGPAAMKILADAGLPDFPGLSTADWKGTPALTRAARQVAGERWFAVGDAAGYVEPFTGEGIGWAISSAVGVCPFAVRAATSWNDELAHDWARAHRRIVGRRQTLCRAVAWTLRRPRLCAAAVQLLRLAPALSRPVIRLLHRPAV
jgi:flavin-dependent dehydrogenase